MVQAADFWNLHDLARLGAHDRPKVGGVLVEREVGARLMVIGEVTGQDATQASFAEDKNVVETLAADRTVRRSANGICQGLCGGSRTSRSAYPSRGGGTAGHRLGHGRAGGRTARSRPGTRSRSAARFPEVILVHEPPSVGNSQFGLPLTQAQRLRLEPRQMALECGREVRGHVYAGLVGFGPLHPSPSVTARSTRIDRPRSLGRRPARPSPRRRSPVFANTEKRVW